MRRLMFMMSFCLSGMIPSLLKATEMMEYTIFAHDAFNRPVIVTLPAVDDRELTPDEQGGVFKYDGARICDTAYTRDITPIQDVLEEVDTKVQRFRRVPDLTLSLRDNYLTDIGFQAICQFIREHADWKEHLVFLDLTNNRVTKEGLTSLRETLDQTRKDFCVKLSINYITPEDINRVLPTEYRERVICTTS